MRTIRLTILFIMLFSIAGFAWTGCSAQPASAPESRSGDILQTPKTSPNLNPLPGLSENKSSPDVQIPASQRVKSSEKLVFVNGTNDPGGTLIYTCNIDGSNWIKLSGNHSGADLFPKWSPDGSKIVFYSDRDGRYYQIYVMNADGSNPMRLTRGEAEDTLPAWSPDGKKIAFTSNRDGGNDHIFIMNADGSNIFQLTRGDNQNAAPSWSPDGSKIVFQSKRDGNIDIYVINTDGSNLTRLTDSPQIEDFPAWSPDGKKIAYQSNASGNFEIYVMNADGTDQRQITQSLSDNKYPAWSPDGTRIVFYSKRDCNNDNGEIYIMNADGSNQVRITRSDCTDSGLASWR